MLTNLYFYDIFIYETNLNKNAEVVNMITFKNGLSFNNEYLNFVFSHFDGVKLDDNGQFELSVKFGDRLEISKDGNFIDVTIYSKSQLFFALSTVLTNLKKQKFTLLKQTPFESVNFMYDCSRAAVLNVSTVKKLIVYLAKLGFTGLELYTEDTYEITEEPYFGHLRGRFSKTEIREIDGFAKNYGIELIPCIQTLAHLDNIFLWPRFDDIHDNWDCLLIGDDKTYDLIEKMFKNIADCFSSRTINIGYDEAYYAGRGKFLDKNGYKNKTEILFEHLKKVTAIGGKYGFKCVIYSDMFFNNKSCLDREDLPRNLEFNYWNYYSTNKKTYDKAFTQHLEILSSVNYTAGAWKWLGHSPFNKYGTYRLKPGVLSASEHNVKTITLSAWGDNGNECSLFAIIPQLVFFSELTHFSNLAKENLNAFCKAVFDVSFNDFLKLDIANGHKNKYYRIISNPAKYILYNDPLCGLMDFHIDESYNDYFSMCVNILKNRKKRANQWAYLFNVQIALCDYLSVKANMGNDLYNLYSNKDKAGLKNYALKTVPKAIKKLNAFIEEFRTAWYKENKTFGFDVMENRLGGQMQRLYEVIYRIEKYLDGSFERIEELEQPKLPYNYPNEKGLIYKHNSKFIISPFYPVI